MTFPTRKICIATGKAYRDDVDSRVVVTTARFRIYVNTPHERPMYQSLHLQHLRPCPTRSASLTPTASPTSPAVGASWRKSLHHSSRIRVPPRRLTCAPDTCPPANRLATASQRRRALGRWCARGPITDPPQQQSSLHCPCRVKAAENRRQTPPALP